MGEYLEAMIQQVAERSVTQYPIQRALRIAEDTFGGTFTEVTSAPDGWENLAANFVVVTNRRTHEVEVYLNHPKTIAAMRERGIS